jgi:hypothetical protein
MTRMALIFADQKKQILICVHPLNPRHPRSIPMTYRAA